MTYTLKCGRGGAYSDTHDEIFLPLNTVETMDKSKRYLVVQDEDRFGDQWAVVEWAKRTDIGLDHNEMEWCICIYSVFHPEVSPGKSGPPELHQYADPINIKGWVLELPDI